jgi:phospholipase D1/2
MVQPPIWFLTPQEITDARDGCSRGLNPYSLQGNSVKLLVNGDQVFNQLYQDLLAVGAGDFVWMTGWDIDSAVMLYPNPKDPVRANESRIDKLLLAAIDRGVELRMLLSSPNLDPPKPVDFARPLNEAAGKTVCSPDQRHNSAGGSLHQKSWVIKRNGETVAYVGSMDIAAGRFDTSEHDQGDSWKLEPRLPPSLRFYGFTDGMLYIRGQAVLDIARHLFDQITDPVDPFPGYSMAPTKWPTPPIGVYDEPAQIQVLLTAGPRGGVDHGYYSNWAPRGELTILAATLKAISRATRYIYLNDQYMWYPPILEAIAARLPHVDAVLLLTDSGHAFDYVPANGIPSLAAVKFYYQHLAWKSLQGKPGVSAYHMIKEGLAAPPPAENMHHIIYTHWKALIIDDEFAIVGSAGVEQSGMTNDLDMSVGICDPATVTGIRKQLWSEHLNVSPEDPRLDDPISAIERLWPAIAGAQPPGRVRRYWPDDVEWNPSYGQFFESYEPCGLLDPSKCTPSPTPAEAAAQGLAALGSGLQGVVGSRGYFG